MITVILQNDIASSRVPTEMQFQQWVDAVAALIPDKISTYSHEIGIAIIDVDTSASLNEKYRQKKGPTNVLSFTYDAMPESEQESLGDLAICAAVVETEAKTQRKLLESHWAHMTIHGMLHLLGYDHVDDNDATLMETLEIKILNYLGFKDPYV